MTTSSYFYHGLLKKSVQIFGSRFNDIQIKRESSTDVVGQTINVPIQYAPIQKELARLQADADGKRSSNIIYPRMSFEITDIQRDTVRSISKNKRTSTAESNHYVGTPYNLTFQLNVVGKNMEDTLKIVEQILPYFNPNLGISAMLIDNSTEVFSIPLELQSVSLNDTYEGDFITRRAIIWNLIFVMRYQFFGPSNDSSLIKFVQTNIYSDPAMLEKDIEYTTYPGLTANGTPTSNSEIAIPYANVNIDDDYGFIHTSDEYPT